jgi:hypothetical protein
VAVGGRRRCAADSIHNLERTTLGAQQVAIPMKLEDTASEMLDTESEQVEEITVVRARVHGGRCTV